MVIIFIGVLKVPSIILRSSTSHRQFLYNKLTKIFMTDTFLNLSRCAKYDVKSASKHTVLPVPVGISKIACPVESNVFFKLYI
jgi:hypothetical protein